MQFLSVHHTSIKVAKRGKGAQGDAQVKAGALRGFPEERLKEASRARGQGKERGKRGDVLFDSDQDEGETQREPSPPSPASLQLLRVRDGGEPFPGGRGPRSTCSRLSAAPAGGRAPGSAARAQPAGQRSCSRGAARPSPRGPEPARKLGAFS